MLVRGVVECQVRDDADAARVRLLQELLEIGHRAVARVNGTVVRDVVAVVAHGRVEHGRQPEAIHAQPFQVVELVRHSAQIAHAVPVRVVEGVE